MLQSVCRCVSLKTRLACWCVLPSWPTGGCVCAGVVVPHKRQPTLAALPLWSVVRLACAHNLVTCSRLPQHPPGATQRLDFSALCSRAPFTMVSASLMCEAIAAKSCYSARGQLSPPSRAPQAPFARPRSVQRHIHLQPGIIITSPHSTSAHKGGGSSIQRERERGRSPCNWARRVRGPGPLLPVERGLRQTLVVMCTMAGRDV